MRYFVGFGDYNVVVVPSKPVLIAQGFITNGYFGFKLLSTTNIVFGIQASSNLVQWTSIGSGFTDTNGLMQFQDTNSPGIPYRFYRAYWPYP